MVIVGAGPIGQAADHHRPVLQPSCIVAVDLAQARLDAATQSGDDIMVTPKQNLASTLRELTAASAPT